MTFQPQMDNRIEGFSVLQGPRRRNWNGMAVDLWDVECLSRAGGYYVARDPRLFVALETSSGQDGKFLMSDGHGRNDVVSMPPSISYIPAGMEIWAFAENIRTLRHLDLHFDAEQLRQRLREDVDADHLASPRLLFSDPRIMALAALIAAECENPDPLHDLYGDGLTLALLIDFFKLGPGRRNRRTQLAQWQLRRAVDFIEANCMRRIRLEELADMTNLSQSHFSHAFKASTGMPPHQWQMHARIDRVKAMLLEGVFPLTAIATIAGFSDQAHFSRVFRKVVGVAPLAWQRQFRA